MKLIKLKRTSDNTAPIVKYGTIVAGLATVAKSVVTFSPDFLPAEIPPLRQPEL